MKRTDVPCLRRTPSVSVYVYARKACETVTNFVPTPFAGFSNLNTMRTFLRSLYVSDRMCIQDIEIDFRNLNSDNPHITREWLDYTASEKPSDCLRKDAVGLKCLRLNFEAWPVIAMFRVELWNFLRNMLSSRMSRSVLGRQEDKAIRWARADGKLQLEVVSRPYRFGMGTQEIGPSRGQRHTDPWPLNGSCNCSNDEDSHSDFQTDVNPSAVG
jgi:hypothetical protein